MPLPRKARRPSKPDAAPPDSDRELRGLELFLRQTREFRLALALYSDVRDRDEMIARLGSDLAGAAIQVLTVNLTEVSPARTLSGRIEAALKAQADPARHPVVMVVNLDAVVEHLPELSNTVSEGTEFFATANLHRELFPRLCPAPLVIWLTESMERAFAAQAPDLWHWRSHIFDLRTPRRFTFPPEEADSTKQLSALDRLHAETRLHRLEEEIAAYRKVGSRSDEMRVLLRMGNERLVLGQPRLARYDYEAALQIAEELGNEDWQMRAESGIANAYAALGDFEKAEPLYRRALEAQERTLGAEHPNTLTSLNNLAVLLVNQGDLAGAEPLFRRALEVRERTLGTEHPDTLNSLNNLANLLADKGDLAGAEPLYRRALEAQERTQGADHPDTLSSLNNLANLVSDKGDLAGAEPLYRRVLEGLERTLGAEHPDTLRSLNNRANLLADQGDLAGAESLYRRALEAMERTLGAEHPYTLVSLNNLAILLKDKGDLAGAEPLYRRVLEVRERTLGAEHPDTLGSLNNLAILLKQNGDLAGAEPLYRRALEARERTLGADHPDTLVSLNNLGALREAQGDWDVAEGLYRRAVAGARKLLLPEHLDRQRYERNWARALAELGRAED